MTITEHPLVEGHLSDAPRQTAGHSDPRTNKATDFSERPPAPRENWEYPLTTLRLPAAAGAHLLRCGWGLA